MAKLISVNPDDPKFLELLKGVKEGDIIQTNEGDHEVEGVFDVPTHFPFHQRIFPPGIILHKLNSNVRVYIEAEKVGIKAKPDAKFKDRQIRDDGTILPADKGTQYQPKK